VERHCLAQFYPTLSSRLVAAPAARHNARHVPAPSTPRRLTFKRVLLAVVLGLAAWWGVVCGLSRRTPPTLSGKNTGDEALPLRNHVRDRP
jgi:hypothetical protein